MESTIRIVRDETGDVVVLSVLSMKEFQLVSAIYVGGRFGLDPQTIHLMRREENMMREVVDSEKVYGVVHWSLKVGCEYIIGLESEGKRFVI